MQISAAAIRMCHVTEGFMIFRISQKLGQKMKVGPVEHRPLDANALADWSAHLFTAGRVNHVILTNTRSLYSVLMLGRGITNQSQFVERALACIEEFMAEEGQGSVFKRLIAPAAASIRFSTALNRSVVGSINDSVHIAKMMLTEDKLSLHEAASMLNQMPMSYLDYDNPRERFRSLQAKRTALDMRDV
jgi:hypothetical protein